MASTPDSTGDGSSGSQGKSEAAGSWFARLFGAEEVRGEGGFEATQALFAVEPCTDAEEELVATATGRRFRVGRFETPSLAQLREREAAYDGPDVSGSLELVNDIGEAREIHTQLEAASAVFQVASQFNCLEFTSCERTPEEGVSGYVHDATQGPACAVACAPATVFRNYLVQVPGSGGVEPQCGQTTDVQLNTLDEVEAILGNRQELDAQGRGRFFWMKNGYVCSDAARLELLRHRLEELGEEGRSNLRSAVKVGVALGSEVSFSALVPFEGLVPMPAGKEESCPRQVVSQVFSAAANVRTRSCGADEWEPFARLLLEATYEAALWAAVRNARVAAASAASAGVPAPPGSRRVMLTSVGGGVFGNRQEWIMDAMNRALGVLAAEAPPEGWGLEVCIAHFEALDSTLEQQVRLGASRAPA
mmetsp:Transcript_43796/g.139514  ORF Transcript_43796/g.139514 Transcript_43796/m.139514 type:complete len:420 (-) Transcript_43796:282-1541(-)